MSIVQIEPALLFDSNMYMVIGSERTALIDTGTGFKVDSTRCEVSAFLCSAQSPLRAQAVGGARVPRRPKESWLPPDLDISATLCQFTPSVSPFLPCPLHPQTSCYSSGPNGWLRWNSFILNVMPRSQAHTYLVQLPHCCSMIFLKFLSRLNIIATVSETLESPLDSKEISQLIIKKINPEYSVEGLMLKLQYFGHLM